ncbi:MAG: FAD-dependent monooxygenase, partial [Thermoplasmata archaeon]|nr:FAD-dependent monooxygenase [Thermoplasmata archaeon]
MEKRYDVVVVGAGPVGGHIASVIAGQGFKALIVEEHGEIGEPMQCAGIFSSKVLDIVGSGEKVLNHIKGAYVHSPSGKRISVLSKEEKAVVVDRAGFDRDVISRAMDKGADLALETKALGSKVRNGHVETSVIHNGEKATIESKLIVGADGVNSDVAKWFGLPSPPEVLPGYEAEMEGVDIEEDRVSIFVGT